MFDVIVIGGASRDVFFEVSDLETKKSCNQLDGEVLEIPYGDKIIPDSTHYSYGGGAVNVSVCLSRLGLKAASVCTLGHEGSGNVVKRFLEKEKVNTKFIRRDHTLHTALSVFIVGKDGEHTGFLERGANNHFIIERWRPLAKTKWFYVSGGASKIVPEIFDFARKHNIKVAFNPDSRNIKKGWGFLGEYIEQSEILLVNKEEAKEIVASKIRRQPKNALELTNEAASLGATISVVTDGEQGSSAYFEGNQYFQTSPKVKALDTTGAGDAFGGTFLSGIVKGFDIRYCLNIAAENSASVVTKMGATEGLLSYNKLKSLSYGLSKKSKQK